MAASSSNHVDQEEFIVDFLSHLDNPMSIMKENDCRLNLNIAEDFDYTFVPVCSVKTLDIDLYNKLSLIHISEPTRPY